MKVSFSKNAWHVRLQRWTFGDVRLRSNLCPHFWITVFCVIVFLPVAFFRSVMYALAFVGHGLMTVLEWIDDKLSFHREQKVKQSARRLTLSEAYTIHQRLETYYKLRESDYWAACDSFLGRNAIERERLRVLLREYQELHPDWEATFKQHAADLERLWKEWADAEKARLRRKEMFLDLIAVYMRSIFRTLQLTFFAALAIAAVGLAGLGVYLLVTNFATIPFLVILTILGCVAAIIGFAIFAWWLGELVFKRAKDVLGDSESDSPGLIKSYIKAAKEDYCPGIEWHD